MWELNLILLGGYLLGASIKDIQTKKVPYYFLGVGVIIMFSFCIDARIDGIEKIAGILIGGIFLLVSKCSKEALGYGDGLVIGIIGGSIGSWRLLEVLSIGILLCTAFVCLGKLLNHLEGKQEIPFLPFLFLGYIGMVGL